MKLYHGTRGSLLPQIQAEGLKPRGDGPTNWEHTVPSRNDLVYLTDAYPFYFAGCAARAADEEWAAVLEVEIDETDPLLHPDEDFVAQVLAMKEEYSNIPLLYLTQAVVVEEFREAWQESLRGIGTCSYKGTIPYERVTRYALVSDGHFLFEAAEAQISVMNYRYCADWYKALLKLGFGDVTELQSGSKAMWGNAEVREAMRLTMEKCGIPQPPPLTIPEEKRVVWCRGGCPDA